MVLDVYKRPFDPLNPVICMDESPKQLIAETIIPIPCSSGKTARYDYEYKRCGVCNIFLACEPLAGKRMVNITERKTKQDWAYFREKIALQRENANKITLIMDNQILMSLDLSMKHFHQLKQRHCGIGLSLCTHQNMEVG